MRFYSYLVEHDFGLAPNPFWGYCTLTVCKPIIRKSKRLQIGDWIIGTASKALGKTLGKNLDYHLVYAMQVTEIISIEEYWEDSRFKCKRPTLNGSLPMIYGDNFYHKDIHFEWIQEDSAHSNSDGTPNLKHLHTDISGKNAIISKNFYYFGQNAPLLPNELWDICHKGIGQKLLSSKQGHDFISWLKLNYEPRVYGKPINWVIYNQQKLF